MFESVLSFIHLIVFFCAKWQLIYKTDNAEQQTHLNRRKMTNNSNNNDYKSQDNNNNNSNNNLTSISTIEGN